MSKQETKGMVPELRFPEFHDEPACERKKLSDLLFETKQRNRELKYGKSDVLSVSGEYGCVNQIEFMGRSYAGASVKDYHIVDIGDIVYTKSPLKKNPYGIIKENKGKSGIVSTLYAVYRTTEICRSDYLDHYFTSDYNLNSYLQPLVNKGAKNDMKVKNSDVLKGEIFIPKPDEQQKIADCLSSLDELIIAQAQKIDTLKAHKKGLMQQLFPAEGETVPKLRFPEFRNAEEWKERPLKKVFSIFQGFAFSSNSVNEGVRWLKIADVSIQQMNNSAPSYLPIEYKEKYEKFSVKQGDYVIALTRPILSKQLKIASVDKVFHGALLNQRVGKLVTAQNIAFVYFLLQTTKLISDIEKNISGSEPPNLSAQQIKDIKTYIPSEKEQEKIADCLSSIDELIAAHAQKLYTLKIHKKGLMQQLFPSIDEVNE